MDAYFKAARQLLVERGERNDPAMLSKLQMRTTKFEKWEQNLKRGGGAHGFLKTTWAPSKRRIHAMSSKKKTQTTYDTLPACLVLRVCSANCVPLSRARQRRYGVKYLFKTVSVLSNPLYLISDPFTKSLSTFPLLDLISHPFCTQVSLLLPLRCYPRSCLSLLPFLCGR